MESMFKEAPILVIGNGKLTNSVTVCLLLADHSVTLLTHSRSGAREGIAAHFADLRGSAAIASKLDKLEITEASGIAIKKGYYKIGIGIANEDLAEKRSMIRQLEEYVSPGALVAMTTESIPLDALQQVCNFPERLIGLNWVEPAHTTFFLELITNDRTDSVLAESLFDLGKTCWKKDPYLISKSISIRAKMLSGMVREAFYLVQNGYATIEDIDRACRNDAGYYLPFAGNFRYMDLMGTYAYGLVMKDLNRELSNDTHIPAFLEDIIEQGGEGMENNKGFYKYDTEDVKRWDEIFKIFSYQIQRIIEKYPFNHKQKAIYEPDIDR